MKDQATPIDQDQIPGQESLFNIPCITQDAHERKKAGKHFLEVCTKIATLISKSKHCPPECGGHPICQPCYDLAKEYGFAR